MESKITSYLKNYEGNYIDSNQLDVIYQLMDEDHISLEKQRQILEKIEFHNKQIYFAEQKTLNMSQSLANIHSPIVPTSTEDAKRSSLIKPQSIVDIDIQDYIAMLKKCHTIEEILEILPKRDNVYYHQIIHKILLYYYQYKVEIINLLNGVDNLSEEEIEQFREEESSITNVMEMIHDFVIQGSLQEDTMGSVHRNQLLFLQTSNVPRVFHSLSKNVDSEYYKSFSELFYSIINGTFKGFRTFTNSNHELSGIYEVRGFKTRILFDRIAQNKYVILDAFIKKCDTDLRHQFYIKNAVSLYRMKKKEIKEQIYDEDFLKQQALLEENLFEMLKGSKKKVLQYE